MRVKNKTINKKRMLSLACNKYPKKEKLKFETYILRTRIMHWKNYKKFKFIIKFQIFEINSLLNALKNSRF